MQEIVSPLQSISYTNKDFQRIYPELLDLVKQLTNKWDPSISNESDPGVILIKLNALIADKCNYNIDKNVLECFPLSVTQNKNARQLFDQLGYRMKWYRSATVYMSLKWIGDIVGGVSYTIPAFTMVTDAEKTVVYTLVGSIPSQASQEFNVSPIQLLSDGKTINAKAIQGIAVKYDINGDTIITPQHLDQDNRIYFNVNDIAENGIFITNTGTSNYESWIQKDNLLVEEYGNTFYKFGVTADGSTCYIEFPADAQTIMKDGIEIIYIRTNGSYGTVKPQQLTNFYSDVSVVSSLNNPTILSTQNVQLVNYFSSSTGYDPETIDEAYKNYKRIIGTYKTLITLRDYLNYILSNNLASNGFTCDRSNDLQCTYDIMTYSNGLNLRNTEVETNNENDPILTAFSLKLYLLKYFSDISTVTTFNESFTLQNESQLQNVKDYISDLKALQHDYAPILASTDDQSHICFFKNKYPVKCTIIPQYKLSSTQEADLKNNIYLALYKNLNSNELEFGDKISQDYLYTIISQADARIKNVILDSIEYTTYATYLDSNTGTYKEVQVSGDLDNYCVSEIIDSSNNIITTYSVSVDNDVFVNKLIADDNYSYSIYTFTYNGSVWKLDSNTVTLATYGIVLSAGASPSNGDKILVQVSKQTQFKDEIFAKSVLAGITPFFIQDEEIDLKLDQSLSSYNFLYPDIKSVSSAVSMTLTNSQPYYRLRDNETIQLFAPNLLQKATYNNYVKFEIKLSGNNSIDADTYYELGSDEYIIFYWKSSSRSTLYQYAIYGTGSIIKATFALTSSVGLTTVGQEEYDMMQQSNLNTMSGIIDAYSTGEITALTASQNILSADKEIGYFVPNNLTLNKNYLCYWVLNDKTIVNDNQFYTLFSNGETERILESGEYFFYTNNEMQSFVSLGSGTRLQRNNNIGQWTVNAIDLSDITMNGISILSDYWFRMGSSETLDVEEDQFISISSNQTLKLSNRTSASTWSETITSSALELDDYDIYYTDYQWSTISDVPDSEWIQVPYYQFTNFSPWSAKSSLMISCSNDNEQILLNNQSITITDINNTSTTITGQNRQSSTNQQNYYPVVIKTNDILAMTGLNEHSTVSYDSNLQEVYLNFYVYSKQLTRNNIVNYLGQNIQILIQPGQSQSNSTYPPIFTLPVGQYLIPVITPSLASNTYIKISFTDITANTTSYLTPIYDSTMTTLEGSQLYPLHLNITSDNHQYSLVVQIVDGSSQAVTVATTVPITFNNPYRYVTSNSLTKILYLIKMFDPNHKFNYTYTAPQGQIIENPLEAIEFLNMNHIYHDFTICQLDTSSLNNLKVNY